MSSFHSLRAHTGAQNGCVEVLLAALQAANDASQRILEATAASKIQSIGRMYAQKKSFRHVLRCIVNIQRSFRGYRDRKKALRVRIQQQKMYNAAVFDHFATLIQSRFRGFILRKRHCDFYARKRYIQGIVDQNEKVRDESISAFQAQQSERERTLREEQRNAFVSATKNLHHLLSTSCVSGVFRPPLSVDGAKTVFGTNIEDDLRSIPLMHNHSTSGRKFKPDLPQTGAASLASGTVATTAAGGTTGAGGGGVKYVPRAPSQSIKTTTTFEVSPAALQNAAVYQVERVEQSLQHSVDKKLQSAIHGGSSFLTRKPEAPKFQSTINAETPYVERSSLPPRKR